jgi:putative MATE family efflux protein
LLDPKEINKLAIPAILYNITEPLIGLVDTAVIGQMEGDVTSAQAGIGLAAGLISTLVWGLAQIRTAVSSLVSQYLGKNKLDKIASLIPQSLIFSALVGVLFWLITALYFIPIANFLFINKSPEILNDADLYYQIRAIGLPFSLLIAGLFGIFRGFQNTRLAMYAAFIGGAINVILDIIFVKHYNMGIAGVAWASVISQLAMVLMCLYFLIKKTPFSIIPVFKLNHEFKNMLLIAGNMLIRTLALNVSFLVALRYASKYGEASLAAYAIGIQIWLFSSFFIDGYSTAGNAMAGKYLGENNREKLRALVIKLLKINLYVAVGLGLCYAVCYPFMGAWFNDSTEVVIVFNSFLWLVIIAQPLNSIAFTMDGIFKGMGKAKLLRNTLLIGSFLIFIPTLILTDYLGFEVISIWLAFIAWMAFRGISLTYWFFKKEAHT